MRKLSKKEWIAAAVALVFVAYMFFGDTIVGVFSDSTNGSQVAGALDNQNISMVQTQDIVVGNGAEVKQGLQIGVNYILSLSDGTLIQNSKEVSGGEPFKFISGAGQLIKGWEAGVLGMKVGGKRRLIIPPEFGYGAQAVGPIPANSTLVFDIEVVSVEDPI